MRHPSPYKTELVASLAATGADAETVREAGWIKDLMDLNLNTDDMMQPPLSWSLSDLHGLPSSLHMPMIVRKHPRRMCSSSSSGVCCSSSSPPRWSTATTAANNNNTKKAATAARRRKEDDGHLCCLLRQSNGQMPIVRNSSDPKIDFGRIPAAIATPYRY